MGRMKLHIREKSHLFFIVIKFGQTYLKGQLHEANHCL
jgi:hypothetical protein